MKKLFHLILLLSATLLAVVPLPAQGDFNPFSLGDLVKDASNKERIDPIVVSTDGGATWQARTVGLPPETIVSELVAGSRGEIWIATDKHGVYQLPAGAGEWQHASAGLPRDVDVNALAVRGDRLVIGTFRQGILYSADCGQSWQRPVFNVPGNSVRSLLFLSDTEVLAGTDEGLYHSADGGKNWSLQRHTPQINALARHGNTLYIARADGLFRSKDFGESISQAEIAHTVTDLYVDDNYILAYPMGKNVLRRHHQSTTWESPQASPGSCLMAHTDLATGFWNGLLYSNVNAANFRPLPGISAAVGFVNLIDKDGVWIAACRFRGC